MFIADTPSHDSWLRFVDHFPELGIEEIIKFLETTYASKFSIGVNSWWIEFPDPDTKLLFEITWL